MTIREVEERLGLPRASIRFYEKEGLLAPARGENGYRDYSEANLATLEKIKLLRQLGVSLEEIAALQKGESDLPAALGRRLEELGRQATQTARAADVCRQMRSDGVSYAALEPQRYLSALSGNEAALAADVLPTVGHPWRRYFARALDLGLCALLWTCIEVFLLRMNTIGGGTLAKLAHSYLGWGLLFVLEPVLLCTWGYTPGKFLFGLQVRDEDGEKLTWWDAIGRLGILFAKGEGYGVPGYSLYCNWKSYKQCTDNTPCPWDEEVSYTIRDENPLRCVGFVVAEGALVALLVLVMATGFLPPKHGPLTPETYAANITETAHWRGCYDGYTMDSSGVWEKQFYDGTMILFSSGPVNHQLTVEDGLVTAVRLERSSDEVENHFFLDTGETDRTLALFTLLNHGRRLGSPTLVDDPVYHYDPMTNTTFEKDGWRVTYTVEQKGYQGSGDYRIAAPDDMEEAWYHWSCVIERI